MVSPLPEPYERPLLLSELHSLKRVSKLILHKTKMPGFGRIRTRDLSVMSLKPYPLRQRVDLQFNGILTLRRINFTTFFFFSMEILLADWLVWLRESLGRIALILRVANIVFTQKEWIVTQKEWIVTQKEWIATQIELNWNHSQFRVKFSLVDIWRA